MKKNALMIFGMMMLAVVLVARADGQLDAAKTAPAEKPAKKAKASAATIAEKPVVLSPGAATIAGLVRMFELMLTAKIFFRLRHSWEVALMAALE